MRRGHECSTESVAKGGRNAEPGAAPCPLRKDYPVRNPLLFLSFFSFLIKKSLSSGTNWFRPSAEGSSQLASRHTCDPWRGGTGC